MDLLHWILFGVLPALASVLLFVGIGGARMLAPAIAVAMCVPFGMDAGWPDWPWHLSVSRSDPVAWFWWALAFAGVVGAAYDTKALPRTVLGCFEVALVVFVPWALSGSLRARWSFEWCVVMLGLAWTILVAIWWGLRTSSRLQPGMAVPLAGTVVFVADAILLHARGDLLGWRLAGVAAVASGVSVATTLWRRPFVCGTGASLCITIAHAGVLWFRRSEGELTRLPFVLALLAPLGMWIATTKAFADGRTTGMAIGVLATAGLATTAIGLA
ncbi:MAG: hypothetical protein JNK78_07055 [Planctomycetes bacterium]|nr:hypothetical protein [Planctomycetota bacterium]